jgi:hypothetical protein
MGDAGAEGDGHLVVGDQVADQRLGVLRHVPQAAGMVAPTVFSIHS